MVPLTGTVRQPTEATLELPVWPQEHLYERMLGDPLAVDSGQEMLTSMRQSRAEKP